jgi:kumamolisin
MRILLTTIAALALGLVVVAPAAAGGATTRRQARDAARITFYLGLQRPEARARAAFTAVSRPGSPAYRRFLTPRAAARRYGASRATIAALRRVARGHGLSARVDASGVFARVSGPVARMERVFGVRIRKQFDNDVFADIWVPTGDGRLRLPRELRPLVREVVASYSASAQAPRASAARGRSAAARAAATSTPPPGNAGTWIDGCAAARGTGAYSFAQVRTAYGIATAGAGARIALLNVGEGIPAADVAIGGRCFGLPRLATTTLLTDGQRRAFGRGSFEPQEDLALARGMAPALAAATFAQVWLAPELWFLGPAAVLGGRPLPDALSISYGECERDVRGRTSQATPATRGGADLMDAILVRLGLVGVSAFASAGDFGSTCNGEPFAGVAWPASSPYLTAVGGSRLVLDPANQRVEEVVWNDLAWLGPDDGGGAGGGGNAAFSARPPYQSALIVPGRRRSVPDVAAHASMLPGWPVSIGSNWVEDAGTSASSPLVAGAFAALSAAERAAGRPPLGPVNGLLYALRGSAPDALFDVVAGDNGYDPRVPALRAGPGYDQASGLGVPRFDRIAAALPAPAG